jgi:hypothetical protein
MKSRRIEVEIEELVLHGFPPLDGARLQEAFTRELASLVPTVALRSDLVLPSTVDGGFLDVGPRAGPDVLGTALARRVAGVLTPVSDGGGK